MQQLKIPFESESPRYVEDHSAIDDAKQLSIYLATEKANSLRDQYPEAIIIGSDQTAVGPESEFLQKPGTPERAFQQLSRCSGKSATFYSGICLIKADRQLSFTVSTTVTFRTLTDHEIRRYIELDNPLDCAGSFKVESLGISLFDKIESEDPAALIGLPLIQLCKALRSLGVAMP
jgi:MAF protein